MPFWDVRTSSEAAPRYSLKWPILSCLGGVLLFAVLVVRKSMSHCRAMRSMQAMCGNKTGGGGGSCVKREHGKVKTGQTGQTRQRGRSTDRLIPTSNNPINRVCSCHRSPSTAKAVCLGCSPRIIQQASRTIHAVEVEMGKKMVWNREPGIWNLDPPCQAGIAKSQSLLAGR